jgi:ADP-ribose pyrophosphatase
MDSSSSANAPEIVTSSPIFSGRVFSVRQEVVRFPDGREATLDLIAHPGSFGIVAFTSENEIVLVRQYRHAVGEWLWEIPAGTAEPGEAALDGARRELAEETGYRCERIRELGHSFYVTPGYSNERLSLFLAEGLTPGEQSLDEDERIEVRIFRITDIKAMIASGEIHDVKTMVAVQQLL